MEKLKKITALFLTVALLLPLLPGAAWAAETEEIPVEVVETTDTEDEPTEEEIPAEVTVIEEEPASEEIVIEDETPAEESVNEETVIEEEAASETEDSAEEETADNGNDGISVITQSVTGNFSTNYTLTGDGAADICAVALAQYEKTGSQLGYTEDWCADFVGDCAKLAGQSSAIPANGVVSGLYQNIINAGGSKVTSPKVGDIAIMDWNGGGNYSHVEIVYAVSGSTIYTIGGNSGRNTSSLYTAEVYKHTLSLSSSYFTCFVRPNYSGAASSTPGKPVITGVSSSYTAGSTITVTWASTANTTHYNLSIRKKNSSGVYVQTAIHTNVSSGVTLTLSTTGDYAITIVAYNSNAWESDGSDHAHTESDYVYFTIKDATPSAPTMVSSVNTASGVKITWNAVSGASSYNIYRKVSGDSSWTKVGSSSATSYTSTGLTSGKTYVFTVQAVNGSGSSSYGSSTEVICRLSQPSVSLSNTSSGVKVSWGKVTGATKYRVYRKASGASSWTTIVSSTTSTSYTDKTAKSGTTYYYSVRAYKSSYSSSYVTNKTIVRLAQPTVTLTNGSAGVKVSWGKVTGATKYRVYRMAAGASSWTVIKSSTTSTSYTDTAVKSKNGTTYYYAVRAYRGSTYSSYVTNKHIVRLTTPTLSSVTNSASKKMTVKWKAVSGVTGYLVQYSTSSSFSSCTTVKVTGASSVSKVISSLTKGKTYYVRIRTYKTVSGTNYYSGWSSTKSMKISK